MRLPIVLVTLLATPAVAALAQDAAVKSGNVCLSPDAQRSSTSWSRERPADPFSRTRTGCAPQAPVVTTPPPDGGGGTGGGGTSGSVSVAGTVYNSFDWTGLGGWVVQITILQSNGTTTNVSATTNADGTWLASNLPDGTYTICQVVPSGWVQTWPTSGVSCATGRGYSFTLAAGAAASFVDYADQIQ